MVSLYSAFCATRKTGQPSSPATARQEPRRDSLRCCALSALVGLDGAVEGRRGRLSIDQMIDLIVGVAGEGFLAVVRHLTESRANVEGRKTQAVGGVRTVVANPHIAGVEGGVDLNAHLRLIVGAA